MPIAEDRLQEIVHELQSRPGHEKVRSLVYVLLVDGLDAPSSSIRFEHRVPEVLGRADALLGRTVFEIKRDLRFELRDAESGLYRYLGEREHQAGGARFVGIATDGHVFRVYERADTNVTFLQEYIPTTHRPHELLDWLGSVVSVNDALYPDADTVQRELGRESLAYLVAREELSRLWADVSAQPDVALKRNLWASLLERVYGSSVDDDSLFFQHTYLTVVAKTIATRTLGASATRAIEILDGTSFSEAGIAGAVEPDFFNWVVEANGGDDLVLRLAAQVDRFSFRQVQHDVLKALYESLIDPAQRHDLGEYYTPDWLASLVCEQAVTKPLSTRALDPSCGSGTFLFHLVRTFLLAAEQVHMPLQDALNRCTQSVLGIDVHPVAVIIARVTYLLAIGEDRLQDDQRGNISVPVYLGDSLQWNTETMLATRSVRVQVPDGPELQFPAGVAEDPGLFDETLETMFGLIEQGGDVRAFRAWLQRRGVADDTHYVLLSTFVALKRLVSEGRNHIWRYVVRNLARPIWLASAGQKVDVVIGNPPWLAYRFMAPEVKAPFEVDSRRLGVWTGKAASRDLSAYFFVRCVELYLRPGGHIAFVLPYAALNGTQFKGLRRGVFGSMGNLHASVRFTDAWSFDETVQPLFEVPACVLYGTEGQSGGLPPLRAFSGRLPKRNSPRDVAVAALTTSIRRWPEARATEHEAAEGGSPYKKRFRQGSPLVPRFFWLVQPVNHPLGRNRSSPVVESVRSRQEKVPWKTLPSLRGPVESRFLRPAYLSRAVAPLRLLEPLPVIVPWDEESGELLDSQLAQQLGHVKLGVWLKQAEELWREHGRVKEPLRDQIDYFGSLTNQLPPARVRVVYTEAGTLPVAAVLIDDKAIVDHDLYWMEAGEDEAWFLAAIFNSEVTRKKVADRQAKGQWGARHFSKVFFQLPIPIFDPLDLKHQEIAHLGKWLAKAAADADVSEASTFIQVRQLVRRHLASLPASQTLDDLVAEMLGD